MQLAQRDAYIYKTIQTALLLQNCTNWFNRLTIPGSRFKRLFLSTPVTGSCGSEVTKKFN